VLLVFAGLALVDLQARLVRRFAKTKKGQNLSASSTLP